LLQNTAFTLKLRHFYGIFCFSGIFATSSGGLKRPVVPPCLPAGTVENSKSACRNHVVTAFHGIGGFLRVKRPEKMP